ncbi:MAG TPA: isoleucine--tRNA ligase [Myxococcales bacterium]|nr:isoleucine--tRNA ligase [Myxococcales bacterium]
MDIKDTLNLPKTAFPMRAALAEREPVQLKAWQAAQTYEAVLARNAQGEKFILHDGPPYANGSIHQGHFLDKILKDMVVKFQNQAGRLSDYVPGWDCHGLPIELQVDKLLGSKKRELTPGQFRRACRKYAEEQVEVQKREFQRLGVFARWDVPYLTMAFAYEAQIVRELAEFVRRGALYRRKRPVHWCPRDSTALAEAEVEYADKTSPSIYVSFPALDAAGLAKAAPALAGRKLGIAAWTTTPWTIPANFAIVANPEIEYVAYDLPGRHAVVVAKDLLEPFLRAVAPEELGHPERVLAHFTGKDLDGVTYRHPLLPDRIGRVVMGAHATTEAGTGLVHTAPGHGEDDFNVGTRYGLPIFSPVDGQGRFTSEVGIEGLTGVKVFDANERIIQLLDFAHALLNPGGKALPYHHSYPHCWRCKQPVIFRATDQWWLGLDLPMALQGPGAPKTTLRKAALEAIDEIAARDGFIPAWGKERIRGMVENRPDWCVSRQRSWGVPIPVAYCASCREPFVSAAAMEHVADLFEKEGADAWFDRPLTELLPAGSKCAKCGGTSLEKETDILDVWFDSGSSFAAVLTSGRWPGLRAPADLYLEGSDQHRGWFNSSLMIGVGAHGKAPYRMLLTHGFVVDGAGHKMSKSLGNAVDPQGMVKKYGAEVIRLWVAASDYRDDVRLSNGILDSLAEGYRKIRNTLRYCLSQLYDFEPANDTVAEDGLSPLDRWALSRLERYRAQVIRAYETFEFHRVYHATVELCATDLSAFYFDVLKDRTYCSGKDWLERRAAQTVLLRVAEGLCQLLAPIASFTAEEAWQELPKTVPARPASVFLAGLPAPQPQLADDSLEEEFRYLALFREAVNARLEEKRAAKELGKATEAEVTLLLARDAAAGLEGEVAEKYEAQLADLFLCAKVEVETARDLRSPDGAPRMVDARVRKSGEKSCERCWRALHDVGEDPRHPTLCRRCARAVSGWAA